MLHGHRRRALALRWMAAIGVLVLLATACSKKASPRAATSATATVTESPSPAATTATAVSPTPTTPAPTPAPTRATPKPSATTPRPSPPPPAPTAPAPAGPPASAFPMAANFATALAFAPGGRLFWAERTGRVMVWQNGGAKVFATVNTTTTEAGGGYSERGLLGLAISPTFAADHHVYAFYSDGADLSVQHVVRWTDNGGSGVGATSILTFPAGGDCCHKGGRLAFGPTDGKLYVTLGEEHNPDEAQVTTSPLGKVLRYNPDGSIPADDPYAGRGSAVWASGFRNPFGIAISASGQVAVTNNGPTGDNNSPPTGYDTLVFSVVKGGVYQWPDCYGYSHPIPGRSCAGNLIPPDWSSEAPPAAVPTGASFVDGAGPAGLAGHLVFCTDAAGGMVFTPGSPHGTVTPGPGSCRLDIVQGPDHAVYFSDEGHIYRQG